MMVRLCPPVLGTKHGVPVCWILVLQPPARSRINNNLQNILLPTPWLQVIPFPPPDSGLVFQPDPDNPITLQSEYNVYNPKLPLTMGFPGDFCGDNGNLMMIVGSVPKVCSF